MSDGSFDVEDVCFPEMPEQEEIVAMETEEQDRYGYYVYTNVVCRSISCHVASKLGGRLDLFCSPSLYSLPLTMCLTQSHILCS